MFLGSAPFSDMVYVADNLCAGIGGAGVLLAFSCAVTLSDCWQPSEPDCWQPSEPGMGGVAAMIQIADV
ncbi:hypothetical protein Tco_1541639 [Tanacetum coccineum]